MIANDEASATPLVFVYGTLRSGWPQHKELLARKATLLGPASIKGQLFDLGDYPGLWLGQIKKSTVLGEVYRLKSPKHLEALDDYEGCGANDPKPHEYKRVVVTVTGEDGHQHECWVYALAAKPKHATLIPSGDYARALATA
jgi:gamma-glutamylcyclotransferase (GGCT)/AIG2-like uncharacterized protein YtfP